MTPLRVSAAKHVAAKTCRRSLYIYGNFNTLVCISLLGRPRRRWEDNIRMDLREVGCGCVDWIELPQDRDRWRAVVSAVMKLRVP